MICWVRSSASFVLGNNARFNGQTQPNLHMPIRIILSICLCVASLSVWGAEVDDPWYVGAGFGTLTYQQNNLDKVNLNQRYLFVGKQINQHLSAEVHLGNSGSDTIQVSGIPVTLKVDNFVAGFVKGHLSISPQDWNNKNLRVYGMLGGTRIKTTSSDPGYTQSGIQTSISAGAGIELQVNNLAVQLGYLQYVNGSDSGHNYSLAGLHVGIMYLFGDDQVRDAK